jgi:hypothetical protein
MARIDNCDKVVGTGETIIAVGSYKSGEDTRYKYGIKLNIPAKSEMPEELNNKIYNLGLHRAMSVKAAGIFNKANDFGSDEDAVAFATMFSTVEGWTEAFEKVRREGGGVAKVDSDESLAIRFLMKVLRKAVESGTLTTAKVPVINADNPPKTEKGAINYNAWAKQQKEGEHPWYAVAYKKVTAAEKGFD